MVVFFNSFFESIRLWLNFVTVEPVLLHKYPSGHFECSETCLCGTTGNEKKSWYWTRYMTPRLNTWYPDPFPLTLIRPKPLLEVWLLLAFHVEVCYSVVIDSIKADISGNAAVLGAVWITCNWRTSSVWLTSALVINNQWPWLFRAIERVGAILWISVVWRIGW